MAGVKITNQFADGTCHIVRGRVGRIWPHPDEDGRFSTCLLRDREERRRFLISVSEKYFPSATMPTIWIDCPKRFLK
jgi:hypothetical protein